MIATAAPGSLYRMEGGKLVEIFKSNEDAWRSVAVEETTSHIYVGGGSKGIIYRGTDRGSFVAIHDSGLDEENFTELR